MSHKKSLTKNTKATPSDDYTGSDNEIKIVIIIIIIIMV